ncbi:fam-b protein [Plasmodium vinckei vinckei]|uniref:Fam-b protein n=1 Tax=Plasmodium vinckei vinckei TaxID=54757 RepID=A0A449BRV8_PLAVN|nr:fam-b protein [Plasmodium vinckei vinckei]VEV56181.1 fam-b protein [Plasmodium vinckei vinckei]
MKQFTILKKLIYFSIFICSLGHTTNVLCDVSADKNGPTLLAPLDLKFSKFSSNNDYILDLMYSYDSLIEAVAKSLQPDEDCGETSASDDDTKSNEDLDEDNQFGILGGIYDEEEISKINTMKRSIRTKKSDNIYQDKKASKKPSEVDEYDVNSNYDEFEDEYYKICLSPSYKKLESKYTNNSTLSVILKYLIYISSALYHISNLAIIAIYTFY